jgi:hypothetical protein
MLAYVDSRNYLIPNKTTSTTGKLNCHTSLRVLELPMIEKGLEILLWPLVNVNTEQDSHDFCHI